MIRNIVRRSDSAIAAVVLAAGGSRRYGRPKLLEPVPTPSGSPMIRVVVEVLREAGLELIYIIAGEIVQELAQAVEGLPVHIIVNPLWRGGLSTSVQSGLREIPPSVEAVLFVLADQPAISAATIRALLSAFAENDAPIVVPTHKGRPGNPRLFARATFGELMSIKGDEGGRSLLQEGRHQVLCVEVNDEGILLDIDRVEDMKRLDMVSRTQPE